MPRSAILIWPLALAIGLAAVWTARGGVSTAGILDLATGWAILACGMLGWRWRPDSRIGPLFVAAGLTWFVGNFADTANSLTAEVPWLAGPAAALVYLHRGFLAHAVMTHSSGRAMTRLGRVAVAIGYLASLAPAIWRSDVATIALALGFAVMTWTLQRTTSDAVTADATLARRAAIVLSAVLIAGAALRAWSGEQLVGDLTLVTYQVVLVSVVVALVRGLRLGLPSREAVADRIVELDESRSGTLQAALADVLGDPSLRVGFWEAEQQAYVDLGGRPVSASDDDPTRTTMLVERAGAPVAVIVHTSGTLDDPRIRGAVSDAARLAASNASLQAVLREQVAEVRRSRRRLVVAAAEERRRLERRLSAGAGHRLELVGARLHEAAAGSGPRTSEALRAALDQHAATVGDLDTLASGLHPRALSDHGLADAVAELAGRSPVPVALAIGPERWDPDVEALAYYVCAEGLSNIAKYAGATSASVTVGGTEGVLRIVIDDDGRGGAEIERGSGLRGLADRVEAVGGRLTLDSADGKGTRLAAEVPLGGETD
jgi:signal transduction histidine kinase